MIKRLKTFIKDTGKTESAFARSCGIAQKTMNNYLRGQRKPSYEAIEKILLAYPQLSAEWLIRGNGEMNGNTGVSVSTIEEVTRALQNKDDVIDLLLSKIRDLENGSIPNPKI